MKQFSKLLYVLLTLSLGVACNESDTPKPAISEAEILGFVIEDIKANSSVLEDLFSHTETIVNDSIKRIKARSETKAEFISSMNDLTRDVFKKVVIENQQKFGVTTIPQPFSGEAEITLKSLVSQEDPAGVAPPDVIEEYSRAILEIIEASSAVGNDSFPVMTSYLDNQGENHSFPNNHNKLTIAQAKALASYVYPIIENKDYSDEEQVEEIDKVLGKYDVPPIAVAMLLPAIQKVREAAASTPSTTDDQTQMAIFNWLNNSIPQPVQGALDRDLIRRKAYALTFLAGLYMLASDDYQNTNQNTASLNILQIRYCTTLMFTWQELWELE